MKPSLLICILFCTFVCKKNVAEAQEAVIQNTLAYTSKADTSHIVALTSNAFNDARTATISVNNEPYINNYYGNEDFEVYAGESSDLSVLYLKVVSHSIAPINIEVDNSSGNEVSKFTGINHPLTIGYGYKPGMYFIHISQGRKEMVLRFSKGV